MSDDDDDERSLSFVGQIFEGAVAAGTGLPPQIQRSFWKAVGRIFTAGADWPAKALEGRGRVATARAGVEAAKFDAEAADIRSEQKARDLINRESAKSAARRFADPALADRAVEYHAAHIVRKQQRIEVVLQLAVDDIQQNPPKQDSTKEIEEDVLEAILREGSRRSSDEFKLLFGRILSGEIKNPGSFSIGTIQSLGRLTSETATIFQRLCNISSSMSTPDCVIFAPTVIEGPFGGAGQNGLAKFGISYDDLAKLIEEGLVRPDLGEQKTFPSLLYVNRVPFENAGRRLCLAEVDLHKAEKSDLHFSGPAFSKAGTELRQIVTMQPVQEYVDGLADWFKSQSLTLFSLSREEAGRLYGVPVRP